MNNGIVVIGGGAAGMMAAVCAAEKGARVTLLEPNERLGKKLNITGKGRCNVTNASTQDELLAHIPGNARFLYSAFSDFDGHDAMAFFEKLGVPLKVERGARVFPVSDRSFDVSGALERELKRLGVHIVRDRAEELICEGETLVGIKGAAAHYDARAAIVATGGVSYPATGSTGDGYRFAESVGHTVVPPRGSLVPLVCAEEDCAAMQGLSLKNVRLVVRNRKNKVVFDDFGEMLFTHFGISGPLVLSASAHLRDFEKDSYCAQIDLKPALDEKKLEARLLRDFEERSNQNFANLLGGLVNRSMIDVMLRRTGISGDTKVHSVTREQRRLLLTQLKCFTLTITAPRGVAEAIVTSGGVRVGEIQPATMASRKCAGLYFAGEVIDVDAYTGGYNLQIAWATGRAAGKAAADYVLSD